MRPIVSVIAIVVAATTLVTPAFAQSGAFDDQRPSGPNQVYQGPQGLSVPGDQLPSSHDRKFVGSSDPRYSQTQQQQQTEAQRPGGGCLRYGAVGAASGHLAGHGVVGALAGCAVGSYVRHRDNARIRAQSAQ